MHPTLGHRCRQHRSRPSDRTLDSWSSYQVDPVVIHQQRFRIVAMLPETSLVPRSWLLPLQSSKRIGPFVAHGCPKSGVEALIPATDACHSPIEGGGGIGA